MSDRVIEKAKERDRQKKRRERIATVVLQGLAMADRTRWDHIGPVLDAELIERAVKWADALIAELDR